MFVRVKSTPNSPRKSVQIVESVRDGEKVKQRIVRHVGIAMDDQELEQLKILAEHIKSKIEDERSPLLFPPEKLAKIALDSKKQKDEDLFVNLKELKEEQRTIVGIHDIYGKIYQELGFDSILPQKTGELLRNIVMARIANPSSKRASVIDLEQNFGISLNLDRVYRMMDKLDETACKNIRKNAFRTTCELFDDKIDVVFVDATTLYFESFTEDTLKKNGYSKDLKFNQPQVLLALLVTKQGLPIGYEVFPGSTYEGNMLLPLLEKLKEEHAIDKLIFVADSAMFNEKNLTLLEEAGYEYIVGARLRNLPKDLKDEVVNISQYTTSSQHDDATISLRELTHNNRRLIISHSTKRARKDAHDRNEAVEKLRKKIGKNKNPAQLISNYGYKKFLKVKGESSVSLDEEKLNEAAKWDGLHGVITNSETLESKEILAQYRGLWQVEESFRITKHDLKVRPIFHWTPERVQAHIAICFMAFTCVRNLEYRAVLQYKKMSPEAIRKALIGVQTSILRHLNGNRYAIPSDVSQEARKLYQIMGKKYSTTPYRVK